MSVPFALYVFDVYIELSDGKYDCQGNILDLGKKMSQSYRGDFYDESIFPFFCFDKLSVIS